MTSSSGQHGLQIGLDLGGSKIEGILMDSSATKLARYRIATPREDYAGTIAAIVDLASKLMQGITSETKVGIAVPGSISPLTLLTQNANFQMSLFSVEVCRSSPICTNNYRRL